MQTPVLELKHLRTSFKSDDGTFYPAVNDVSLRLERGRILGLVGESGSGKSVTGFSVMGLIDPPGRVENGEIFFMGEDFTSFTPRQMRATRQSPGDDFPRPHDDLKSCVAYRRTND